MTKLTGHFDGKVIVPDEPVNLPMNARLVIHVEPEPGGVDVLPPGKTLGAMVEAARRADFDKQSLREMNAAIEEGCEQVDPHEW
jgi:hypothetical protein